MATLDTNIALGVRPMQIENPMAQYSQIAQIQNARNQNALAKFQLSAAQREEESVNALNDAYANAYDATTGKVDINKLRQTLATSGFGAKLPALEKSFAEMEKEKVLAQKSQTELLDAKLKQSRGFLDTIDPMDPNAPAQYIAWHEANHRDPIVGPALAARGITAGQSRAQIEAAIAKGPQAFADLVNGSKLGTEEFIKMNKPTTTTVNQGGQTQMFQTPGLGGAPKSVGIYADVPLPANVQAQKIQIAQQSRPPAQPTAPTITQIVDPTNTNQMITIDAKRYQGGGVGSPGVIGVGGKEPGAALRVNKVEQGKTQLADDLENLRASFETLDKLRAVPSTERGPLSNVASGIASTAIGQRTGQFFATEAQVERDVINSARSRLVNSIKNATGMSAQQLNSNVELQTMLKSISDPGQSYQSAIRIIQDIEDAYVTGSGMLPKKDKPGGAPAAAQGTGGFKYLGKESK